MHLHRRAGFAATWAEIKRDLKTGPRPASNGSLAGTSRAGGVDDFEATANVTRRHGRGLRRHQPAQGLVDLPDARLARSPGRAPDPHVARSLRDRRVEGRRTSRSMRQQNETFRRLAKAPFGELLNASLREPALLLYLDAPSNRKDHPNENLARELMELFTLGIGHFAEADVKEAARAPHWLDCRRRRCFARFHRDTTVARKLFSVARGAWAAPDLLAILRDQRATAVRLARRLCGLFMGEGVVDKPATMLLADDLIAHRLDVGHAVETILRSRAFFASDNIRSRVVGPVEFVIGVCHAFVPAPSMPSTLLLADWTARLGQQLVRAPQRRRLARRPGVADPAITGRTGQFCRGPRGRPPHRPAGADSMPAQLPLSRNSEPPQAPFAMPLRDYTWGSTFANLMPPTSTN